MQQGPQESSGSGVVVSADGYIVTNNHVIDGADQIKVIFNNKKTVSAKLVGKDASTDLAVLKVDESNLSFIQYGNSDDVRLGQWVLAVGYPLTLETTVTAGIVSAKYRNIGINQQKSGNNAIESFIQTDAAVNPGNSGGALVNARGELIGINAAIASPTGSYAGYSFAIPSNIVKKVVNDMMKFGNVQRAYLGVGYLDSKNATPEQISAYRLDKIEGIYINQIMENSSAEDAGLKVGDVITKIGNYNIKSGPQMLEKIAQYRPGESITINYIRNGNTATTTAKLKNVLGNTQIVKNEPLSKEKLGVQMRDLTGQEAGQLGINGGVYITGILQNGLIAKQTRMKKGFVITQMNEQAITSIKEMEKILQSDEKDFQFGGLYPNYQGLYYYEIKAE
jgi:Do/DeqQ family serine protease